MAHTCYCPNCGHSVLADNGVQCSTWSCPYCDTQMRALQPGDNREARLSRTAIAAQSRPRPYVSTESLPCSSCHYPIAAPSYVGEQVKCAYCGSINEAIQDITVPNGVIIGFFSFVAGAILGPALWQAVKSSAGALERVARERIK